MPKLPHPGHHVIGAGVFKSFGVMAHIFTTSL
jgi:hypothetical protein